jgi:hypothetical protein
MTRPAQRVCSRLVFGALVAVLVVALAPAAWAAPPKIQVTAPLLQFARPGGWVPLHIDISTTEAIDGRAKVIFLDGSDEVPAVTREFTVARNSRKRVVIPVAIPDWGSEIFITLESGRTPFYSKRVPLPPGAMNAGALRVAVVGEEPLGWPLLGQVGAGPVPGHADFALDDGFRSVLVQNLMPSDLPDHWFGYSSVDLLVWRRPDPSGITPEQQEAIRSWIAGGGTAVISLGDNHANWTASPLADLAPLSVVGLERSSSGLGAVWALGGSGLPPRSSADDGPPALPVVQAMPAGDAVVHLSDRSGNPLVMTARPGAGKVVLLTFDVAAGELRGGFDRARFWRELLGLWEPDASVDTFTYDDPESWEARSTGGPRSAGLAGPAVEVPVGTCPSLTAAASAWPPSVDSTSQLEVRGFAGVSSTRGDWWSALSQALGDFKAASPLSLSFIVLFGLLYLLFIGPVDYLVLRRAGKPMLTWISFPVLAIGFSVGAAIVISQQKAGDSETHCLTLVDVMPGPGVERGTSWCSIWASSRADVEVSVPRGKGFALPARHEDFDAYEYGYYTAAITGEDQGLNARSGEAAFAFEAAQWSTSNLRSVWLEPSQAEVLWQRGEDGGPGRVVNRTGMDLLDAWVVDGARWLYVGKLPDGEGRGLVDDGSVAPGGHAWSNPTFARLWPYALEPGEDGVNHLHVGNPGRPMLIAFARQATGHPDFDGLGARDSSTTFVRVQLEPTTFVRVPVEHPTEDSP